MLTSFLLKFSPVIVITGLVDIANIAPNLRLFLVPRMADEVVRSSNFRFGVAPFDIKWCRELESLIRKKKQFQGLVSLV